ncbi:MAG: hypothetical protein M3265_10320 [Actinomycetota bacterium]|nr:hypothetical protein [Actinomycetota bacterium]
MPRRANGRRILGLVVLCAAIGLPACSGSDAPATGTTRPSGLADIDPCVLVTRADAHAVVGAGPAARRGRRIQDVFCSYSMENGYLGVLVATKRFSRDEFEAAAKAGGAAPVPGLGDSAFWRDRTTSLYVLKGSLVLRVDLFTNKPAAALRKAAAALADDALGRISAEQVGTVLTDTSDERPASVNACALVRRGVVRGLVGMPEKAERFTEVGYVGCHWSGANGFVQASLLTKAYSRAEFAAGAGGGRALDGLGDHAFTRSEEGLADVAVLKGSTVFTVRVAVAGASKSALLEAARSLAAQAVGRI